MLNIQELMVLVGKSAMQGRKCYVSTDMTKKGHNIYTVQAWTDKSSLIIMRDTDAIRAGAVCKYVNNLIRRENERRINWNAQSITARGVS